MLRKAIQLRKSKKTQLFDNGEVIKPVKRINQFLFAMELCRSWLLFVHLFIFPLDKDRDMQKTLVLEWSYIPLLIKYVVGGCVGYVSVNLRGFYFYSPFFLKSFKFSNSFSASALLIFFPLSRLCYRNIVACNCYVAVSGCY